MLTLLSDTLRKSLDPDARRRLKAVIDPILAPVGSIHGAKAPGAAIALTFDDGPDLDVTPRVLDLMRARGARATFFVLTDKAAKQPDLMRRITDEGHEVALHFDRHDRLTSLPLLEARARLRAARARLEDMAGPVRFFRPPFGSQSIFTYLIARAEGLEVVSWGPYAEDWAEQMPEAAADKVLGPVKGGRHCPAARRAGEAGGRADADLRPSQDGRDDPRRARTAQPVGDDSGRPRCRERPPSLGLVPALERNPVMLKRSWRS